MTTINPLIPGSPLYPTNTDIIEANFDSLNTNKAELSGGNTFTGNQNFASNTLYIDDTNDRVGIGTDIPTQKFEVLGQGRIRNADSSQILDLIANEVHFSKAGANYITANNASGSIIFRTGGINNRGAFDNNGNFGVGTISPSAKIDILNTGTDNGLFINQDGDGISLRFDSEATTQPIIYGEGTQTSAYLVKFLSTGIHTNSEGMFVLQNNNSSSTSKTLSVVNNGTGNSIFIDQNGTGAGLVLDCESTSSQALYIATQVTTQKGVQVVLEGARTSGEGVLITDNNSSTNVTTFQITNNGTGAGLILDQNGNGTALYIDSASTVKAPLRINNLASDPTGAHVIGDIAVVGGKLKICTVAGTPGTWTVVGTQT